MNHRLAICLIFISFSMTGCVAADRVVSLKVRHEVVTDHDDCFVNIRRDNSDVVRTVELGVNREEFTVVASNVGVVYSFDLNCNNKLIKTISIEDKNLKSGQVLE